MNFCGCAVIFMTFGIILVKAKPLDLDEKEHVRQQRETYHYNKPHALDNELIRDSKDHRVHYIHSKPKAIDDPLPEKVNYVPLVVLDFQPAQNQWKPLFIPALASSDLIPKEEIQPPFNKYGVKSTTSYSTTPKPYVYTTRLTNHHSTAKTNTIVTKDSLEYQGQSSESVEKYVNKHDTEYPVKIKTINPDEDIVFLNHNRGPETGFELFNVNDKIPLISTAPEVIYKPGDDTSFADDNTVFDDYEHTFPPTTKGSKDQTTTQKPYKPLVTTAKSKWNDGKYSEDSAKDNSKPHVTSNSDHGYVYEKPAIAFET